MISSLSCLVYVRNKFRLIPLRIELDIDPTSKTWCSLISSSHFIANHRRCSISNPQNPPSLLFYHFDPCLNKPRLTLHSSYDPFPRDHFTKHLDFSFPGIHDFLLSLDQEIEVKGGFFAYPWDFTELRCSHRRIDPKAIVVGSSHGLICFVNLNLRTGLSGFVLWNPIINKSISLPEPTITSLDSHCLLRRCPGFGYDAKTDDYKLVTLVYPRDAADIGVEIVPPLVEIYTLRTGRWRCVMVPGPLYITQTQITTVFLNGAVHWLANNPPQQGSLRNVIVLFNMEDEAFHEIALPRSLQGHRLNMVVSVFDGSLALVPSNFRFEHECHSVWVMKEYGVTESWTKLLDIDVGGGLRRVVGFGKNGEVLLMRYGRFVSYEPRSQRRMDLHIDHRFDSFYLDTYVESLALLNVTD